MNKIVLYLILINSVLLFTLVCGNKYFLKGSNINNNNNNRKLEGLTTTESNPIDASTNVYSTTTAAGGGGGGNQPTITTPVPNAEATTTDATATTAAITSPSSNNNVIQTTTTQITPTITSTSSNNNVIQTTTPTAVITEAATTTNAPPAVTTVAMITSQPTTKQVVAATTQTPTQPPVVTTPPPPITTAASIAEATTTEAIPPEMPPLSSSCIWRGATCAGLIDETLNRNCDEIVFNNEAGYCDCKGDMSDTSEIFLCDNTREIFFCDSICNEDEDEDEDTNEPTPAPPPPAPPPQPSPSPTPVVTPSPQPSPSSDLPTFQMPMSGKPCGDTCGSKSNTAATGYCPSYSGSLTHECKCATGWNGVDCTRSHIRYRSTIFLKAIVPMQFTTDVPSENTKRAFARTYLSIVANSLQLDSRKYLDVVGLDKIYAESGSKKIVIEFIIHEPLAYKSIENMKTRKEEANTIDKLAKFATNDEPSNNNFNSNDDNLFWSSKRYLLGVTSGADVNIAPSELKLSIDRQDPTKTNVDGEFVFSNTAVKGDELVVNGISYVGEERWVSVIDWRKGKEIRIPPGESTTIKVKANEDFFKDKNPGTYTLALQFKHNVPDGDHAVQISLRLVDSSFSGGSGAEKDISDVNADDVDEMIASPYFFIGMVVGISSFIICICCGYCTCKLCQCCGCCRSRKASIEGRGRSGSTPNRFQRVGGSSNSGVDSDEIELINTASKSSSGGGGNAFGSTATTGGGANAFGINVNNFGKTANSVAGSSNNNMPQLQQQKKPVEYPLLNFISNPTLEPEEYERRWQQMDITKLWGSRLKTSLPDGELERLLMKDHIHCMASGEKEGVSKFYFYAEQKIKSGNTTRLYMVECSFTKATKHIAFVFKTGSQGVQNPQLYIESFINIVRNRIKSMVD